MLHLVLLDFSISNEHPTPLDIHFDEFRVTHTPSNVVQYNEYYPFGLQTEASWTREDAVANQFLYNAGNELNKSTGWYEMFYRGYDPVLGRMLQVDPLAGMYSSVSGYNYSLNNPVLMNDPMGDRVESDLPDFVDWYMWDLGPTRFGPGSGNHWSDQYRSSSMGMNDGGWTLTIGNLTINSSLLPRNSHTVISFQNGVPTTVSQENLDTGSLIIAFLETPGFFSETGWGAVGEAHNLDGAIEIAVDFKSNGVELSNLVLFSHGSVDGSEIHFGDVTGSGTNLSIADYAEGVYSVNKIIFDLLLEEVAKNGNVIILPKIWTTG